MAKAGALAGLSVAAWAAACSPFGGNTAFTCDEDADCQGALDGRCEPTGFCSFADPACEGGRRYGELSGSLANQCIGDGTDEDAGVDATPPEAGEVCYGATGGLVQPCFSQPPEGARMLTGPIDTDTSTACETAVSNTTACVIAGASITIPLGATVSATGSRPLVLVATGAISVDGVLDVASHRVAGTIGAGGNAAGCDAGTPPNTNGTAGGGGAGGSYGAAGGNGGNPGQGLAGNTIAIALRGGCPGQDGREGSGNATTRGIGGAGGGAVYLIANAITISATGIVNASGAGGGSGQRQRAGGGGGGSGGLVGLDAPAVTNQGLVFANGGGGGEGSGDNSAGAPGSDPTGITAAAGGSGASTDGGNGGAGGAGSPGTGQPGLQSADGGGGGGGVGAIRVFPPQTLGGLVSPPAS